MYKYLLLCGLVFVVYSCGNSSNDKDNSSSHEETSVVSSLSNLADAANKMEDNYNDLANATPLTNDELKAWMPDELNGMKRTSYTVGGTGFLKLASLDATYTNTDKSKKITINLIDGADSIGASLIGMARMGLSMDYEKEDQNHVEKSVDKNGRHAIVEYKKDHSSSSIKFIQKDRFLITIEGINVKLEKLWDAIDELDMDELGK